MGADSNPGGKDRASDDPAAPALEEDEDQDEDEDEDEDQDEQIEAERLARLSEVRGAFSPGAPITNRDLFSGRIRQMGKAFNLVSQRGRHGILYGERGVGKTSLAAVVSIVLRAQSRRTVRVNCGVSDSFSTVWRRVFSELAFSIERPPAGFTEQRRVDTTNAEALLGEDPIAPDRVRRALEVVSAGGSTVVFIDEFDRLTAPSRPGFADLIKGLSDYAVSVTVVLVGVADNVDDLVAEHRSVERTLDEILMPRMSPRELRQIVERGLASVSMSIELDALERIVHLSKGLPHYTHLLAQEAAASASWSVRSRVEGSDVDTAIERAIEMAQQTVKNDYHHATYSPQQGNLYADVLRACALSAKDELGFFAPADVRDPLSSLLGRRVDIPTYQQHLNAFITDRRGEVLQRRGEPRRFRYRFRDPLLEPYVIMRGIRADARQPMPSTSDKS